MIIPNYKISNIGKSGKVYKHWRILGHSIIKQGAFESPDKTNPFTYNRGGITIGIGKYNYWISTDLFEKKRDYIKELAEIHKQEVLDIN